MKILFISSKTIEIVAGQIALRNLVPVINDTQFLDCQITPIQSKGGQMRFEFHSPQWDEISFGLEIYREDDAHYRLTYWLSCYTGPLNSFGVHFAALENLRAYLRISYFAGDGSYYVEPEGLADFEPYEPRPETGYAMTQLLPRLGTGSMVLGFDRHDCFQHTFTYDTQKVPADHPNPVGPKGSGRGRAMQIRNLADFRESGSGACPA